MKRITEMNHDTTLIGKEEAIERIRQNKAAAEFYAGQSRITAEIENALKDSEAFDMAIEALQTDADRPHGEWIHQAIITVQGEKSRHEWSCSICGLWGNPDMNYCPNCGADMRNEKEYLDKTFPEHEGGEWLDITDMMTRESEK